MTEQWENSKSSKNTGRTVDKGNKQGISKIKKHRVKNTSDIVGYNEIYALEKVQMMFKVSPESIVFKFIVACHCQQASKCYSQWIENLSCGISPHLKKNIAEKINSTRLKYQEVDTEMFSDEQSIFTFGLLISSHFGMM